MLLPDKTSLPFFNAHFSYLSVAMPMDDAVPSGSNVIPEHTDCPVRFPQSSARKNALVFDGRGAACGNQKDCKH